MYGQTVISFGKTVPGFGKRNTYHAAHAFRVEALAWCSLGAVS